MDTTQQIRLLQITYAAQLADAVKRYAQAGILEQVTEDRRAEREGSGAAQAAQLGIKRPEQAFTTSAQLFGCADWTVATVATASSATGAYAGEIAMDDAVFEAVATSCLLCALAKKAGAPSPCHLFCLDPIESMVSGLSPDARFEVEDTLYEGDGCRVRVTTE